MRNYGRVETSIWYSKKFHSYSDDGKLLWFYLITSPHSNAAGCYVLPIGYVMTDLKWSAERAEETLSELFRKGSIYRCETTNLTVIRGWWDHNAIENPNVAKSILALFERLPRNSRAFPIAINDLLERGGKFVEPFRNRFETLSEPFLNQDPDPDPDPIQEISSCSLSDPKKGRVPNSAENANADSEDPEQPVLIETKPAESPAQRATRIAQAKLLTDAVEIWNARCSVFGFSTVTRLHEQRKRRLAACLRQLDQDLNRWREFCTRVGASADLRGEKNARGWKANFDYVIREDVFTRITEGAYDDKGKGRAPASQPRRPVV